MTGMQVTGFADDNLTYTYDALNRVSTVVDSALASGAQTTKYAYDAVGNRTQMSSTLGAVPAGAFSYDSDDRLALDTYDANGNTISSGGTTNSDDFENHLVAQGGAAMVYDGDGNRVKKTVGSVTTEYLVSTVNPTGYAQVAEESFSGGKSGGRATRTFGYGLERLDQVGQASGQTQRSFYVYDGHGSVRALTDPTGNITDTYDYDAFGNLIHSTFTAIPAGSPSVAPTPNEFLFAGEQYDADLHLYYNRARWLSEKPLT